MESSEEAVETSARVNYNYGVLLCRTGNYQKAEIRLQEACVLYSQLRDYTDSLQNRSSQVQAVSALAVCLTDEGRFDEAGNYYDQAITVAEALASDDDNTDALLMLAGLYNNRGLCFNIQGQYDMADGYYKDATDIYRRVSERTGAPSDAAVYGKSLLNTGENAFKLGSYEYSREKFEEGLIVYRDACPSLGNYDNALYSAWLSYYELVCIRDYQAALDAALNAYQLQSDNVLVNMNLAYACLYCGYYDDADTLFTMIASLGEGQAETLIGDLNAQQRAGLYSPHTEEVFKLLGR